MSEVLASEQVPRSNREHVLERRWEDWPGVPGFFATVDHKRIGLRYIYTSFAFFFVAGLMAVLMRQQLAQPNEHLLSPQLYNELWLPSVLADSKPPFAFSKISNVLRVLNHLTEGHVEVRSQFVAVIVLSPQAL